MKKEFYHDIDLKANQLFNSRLQNVSTSERTTIGSFLTAGDKGYMVYDTDILKPYFWDGTQWQAASSGTWGNITGTITAQTDLINYLSGNYYPLSTNPAGYLTSSSLNGYVPTTRQLTINGSALDLSQDRSWSVGTVTSIATSGLISGGTITTSGTISTSMNTGKLVGRSTAGTGVMEEITVGTGLTLSGGTLSATGSTGGGIPKGTASGTDTYTTTITGVTSYTDGDAYLIRFTNGNTTGCTLNINGLGAQTLYRNNDGSLIGGDIISGAEMICVFNSTLNGFQTIGTAPNTLLGYVTNADSVTITKGQVVYAFGGQGDRMTVKLASNTADATSARTVGVVLSTSIAVNQKGLIIMQGLLDGLNILPTATYSDGDSIYLGSTPGSITKTKPYAPNHLVYVATVTTASNGSAGRMYVNIQNGYELDELHNVQAQSPNLKDTLWYDSGVTPGQWKTASISTILGYTPQSPLTFSTGLTNSSGTVTNNLSTGISGGQSVVGGTDSGNSLTLSSTTNATKGSILFGTSAYSEVNNRLGIQQTTPTSKLHLNHNVNNTTQSDANGLLLANSISASSGVASISPPLIWQGNAWRSVATIGSQDVRFRADVLPFTATAGSASGYWRLSSNINNTSYIDRLVVSSSGSVGINTSTPGSYTLEVVGSIYSGGALTLNSSLVATGSPGNSGQVLTSAGPGASPTWSNLTSGGVAQIIAGDNIKIDPTGGTGNVTIASIPIVLPVPKIRLGGGTGNTKSISILDYTTGTDFNNAILRKEPYVIAQDISQDLLDNYQVFVEMVHYRRKLKLKGIKKSGYVVESAFYANGSWPVPWPSNFWNRNKNDRFTPGPQNHPLGANKVPLQINRPNWYEVTSVNQKIPVWEYLNSRFYSRDVGYRDSSGNNLAVLSEVPIPVYSSAAGGKNLPTNRFSYSAYYTPLYVAFRYILWNPNGGPTNPATNAPYGEIISGPLSRVVRVSHHRFPFIPDYEASAVHGKPCAKISPFFNPLILQCFFETRLP